MPIYEYSCAACGTVFEEWVRSSSEADSTQTCPTCGAEAQRMLSNTSFILKGEGWFASSYGNGTSNAFDKSNGVPPAGTSSELKNAVPLAASGVGSVPDKK